MSGDFRAALADLLKWAESVTAGWVPVPSAVTRARALLAEAQPVSPPEPTDEQGFANFAAWLAREMPANTIIGDPLWWAPRIARAVLRNMGRPAPEPVSVAERLPELQGMFERILCIARSSGGRTVGNIELASRLKDAVVEWAKLPVPQEQADG